MEPSITDWIQAIGVLTGIPVATWSIISLFRKDKEKERQLRSLNDIAVSQNDIVEKLSEQVEQLTIQSTNFQYQSSLMCESNRLFEKQVELQTEIFLHEKGVEEKRDVIVKRKRISEIKPYFISNSSNASPEMFTLCLENKGGNAKKVMIKELETRFAWFYPIPDESNVENAGTLNISGGPNAANTYFDARNVTFEITIEFEDIDGNAYSQNINRLKTGRYIIDEPRTK